MRTLPDRGYAAREQVLVSDVMLVSQLRERGRVFVGNFRRNGLFDCRL